MTFFGIKNTTEKYAKNAKNWATDKAFKIIDINPSSKYLYTKHITPKEYTRMAT